jgi:peptidoglycan hydrolase CwlO-like protein
MSREDTEIVASQLAELTRSVEKLAAEVKAMDAKTVTAQDRADTQQERIDLAARELAEVSTRLQAAANALRESI